jgi:hypothetical protein
MRVCYGILSSSTDGKIVSQLANSLGSSNIFVHHDFSQRPDFQLECGSNVVVLKDYVPTTWGGWSQAEAIIRLMQFASQNASFDYFQLLSESCLPIRHVSEFETYLAESAPDACIGLIKLAGRANDVGTVNYAWRYFVKSKWARRMIGILARACMDPGAVDDPSARTLIEGLSVVPIAKTGTKPQWWLRQSLLKAFLYFVRPAHPFNDGYHCYAGSTWLCLSRPVLEFVLDQLQQRPDLTAHFKYSRSPDEAIVHTIVGNAGLRKLSPINHFISWRERANGPDELTHAHVHDMAQSKRFFARKFSKTASDSVRQHCLVAQASPPNSVGALANLNKAIPL